MYVHATTCAPDSNALPPSGSRHIRLYCRLISCRSATTGHLATTPSCFNSFFYFFFFFIFSIFILFFFFFVGLFFRFGYFNHFSAFTLFLSLALLLFNTMRDVTILPSRRKCTYNTLLMCYVYTRTHIYSV